MKAAWSIKISFWAAIFVSSLWLLLAIAAGVAAALSFLAGGFASGGHNFLEILIVFSFALQPIVVLLLIIRAVRRRDDGQPLRIVARALCPFVTAVLLVGYPRAFEYLRSQCDTRLRALRSNGSMTYRCSLNARSNDHDKRGATSLFSLGEKRHSGKLSSWTLSWPGRKSITAASFEANTLNIGGSEGIAWKNSSGQSMVAYLEFSDLVSGYGPNGFFLEMTRNDVRDPTPNFITTHRTVYYCKPDSLYYRE
jgi:hypothetical protein